MTDSMGRPDARERRFGVASILLSIGLGGFFDGIVLHQVLQWHHMVSSVTLPDTLANLAVNGLGDGIFHASAWMVTVWGIWLLLASGRARTADGAGRRLLGGLLIGWGAFNLVEGVIDHHILGLHHVRPGPDAVLYDVGFLAWGAVMCVVGYRLVQRRGRPRGTRSSVPPAPAR